MGHSDIPATADGHGESSPLSLGDPPEPRFCSLCATPVVGRPVGDEIVWQCSACGHRQFIRQIVGVAVAVVRGSDVLLVQRRFGASVGAWCLPCGHVRWHEDLADAAIREVQEEAGLVVALDGVLLARTAFLRPGAHNGIVTFATREVGGTLAAGDDAADAGFFPASRPPTPMAFETDELIIRALADGRGWPAPDSLNRT